MSILEKIKQRPENQKKIFSLALAVILTLVIVVVWFPLGDSSAAKQKVNEQDKLSSISPMQMIKDEFSKSFSSFNDSISAMQGTSTVPVEITSEDLSVSTSTDIEIATTTATSTSNN